ncbi:MAG: exopolyphosphatase [Acidimicrobiia bacterium]
MRVAAVDIGTNTTRLLIAKVDRSDLLHKERLEWLDRQTTVTRLGQGVDETRMLSEEAIDRTVAALSEFGAAIRARHVEAVRAVATSATRDASNRHEFLARAQLALGVGLEVIPGDEEAALAFRGAVSGLDVTRPVLVIDLGGGSTEFVTGSDRVDSATSVDIGSVRITERFLRTQPAPQDAVEAASRHAAQAFASVALRPAPPTIVGVAGTFTSLAAINLELEAYDPAAVHGSFLTEGQLGRLVGDLRVLDLDELQAIPSLDPARAPVILGGAIVALAAVRSTGADGLVVSEADMLDGVALSAVPR